MKEGDKFEPAPQSNYPRLIMRAFADAGVFSEWDFTPPPDDRVYRVSFECKQDDAGRLYIFMAPDTFIPVE